MPKYEVIATGFFVNHETYDDMLQYDGKHDEVYIYYDTRLVLSSGEVVRAQCPGKVIGDTNNQDDRVGFPLKTGLGFPSQTPWIIDQEVTSGETAYPPMRLWEGELTEDNVVIITPIIVEYDNGDESQVKEWVKNLDQVEAKVVDAVKKSVEEITARIGLGLAIEITFLVIDAAQILIPLIVDIIGRAADRPIGIRKNKEGNKEFEPQSLILNSTIADAAIDTDLIGKGKGVLTLNFVEPMNKLNGDYTLYLKLVKTGN